MSKRLVIPEGILKFMSQKIIKENGKTCRPFPSNNVENIYIFESGLVIYIPKDWLEEIKEPETIEDWLKNNAYKSPFYIEDDSVFGQLLKECHKWTVENERKKHEPNQTRVECWSNRYANPAVNPLYAVGWEDCERNRGYDK